MSLFGDFFAFTNSTSFHLMFQCCEDLRRFIFTCFFLRGFRLKTAEAATNCKQNQTPRAWKLVSVDFSKKGSAPNSESLGVHEGIAAICPDEFCETLAYLSCLTCRFINKTSKHFTVVQTVFSHSQSIVIQKKTPSFLSKESQDFCRQLGDDNT